MLNVTLSSSECDTTTIRTSSVPYVADVTRYTWNALQNFALDGFGIYSGDLVFTVWYTRIDTRKVVEFELATGLFVYEEYQKSCTARRFDYTINDTRANILIQYVAHRYRGECGSRDMGVIIVHKITVTLTSSIIDSPRGEMIVCDVGGACYLSRPQCIEDGHKWYGDKLNGFGLSPRGDGDFEKLTAEQHELRFIRKGDKPIPKPVIWDEDGYCNQYPPRLPYRARTGVEWTFRFYDVGGITIRTVAECKITRNDIMAANVRRVALSPRVAPQTNVCTIMERLLADNYIFTLGFRVTDDECIVFEKITLRRWRPGGNYPIPDKIVTEPN